MIIVKVESVGFGTSCMAVSVSLSSLSVREMTVRNTSSQPSGSSCLHRGQELGCVYDIMYNCYVPFWREMQWWGVDRGVEGQKAVGEMEGWAAQGHTVRRKISTHSLQCCLIKTPTNPFSYPLTESSVVFEYLSSHLQVILCLLQLFQYSINIITTDTAYKHTLVFL